MLEHLVGSWKAAPEGVVTAVVPQELRYLTPDRSLNIGKLKYLLQARTSHSAIGRS